MFLYVLGSISSMLIIPVIFSMLATIISLTIQSNCTDGDTEYDAECRRNRDRNILIRNILGYILLAPIALFVVFLVFMFIYRNFFYKEPSVEERYPSVVRSLTEARARAIGVSV